MGRPTKESNSLKYMGFTNWNGPKLVKRDYHTFSPNLRWREFSLLIRRTFNQNNVIFFLNNLCVFSVGCLQVMLQVLTSIPSIEIETIEVAATCIIVLDSETITGNYSSKNFQILFFFIFKSFK